VNYQLSQSQEFLRSIFVRICPKKALLSISLCVAALVGSRRGLYCAWRIDKRCAGVSFFRRWQSSTESEGGVDGKQGGKDCDCFVHDIFSFLVVWLLLLFFQPLGHVVIAAEVEKVYGVIL
jgi:hypothetical protein